MIRLFDIKDLEKFEANKLSSADAPFVKQLLADDASWVYTQENHGTVKSISCFREESPGEWAIFSLISKHFIAKDSVELKRFLARGERTLKPKKVWTIAPSENGIDKWHRFFGFTFDKPISFNGATYNVLARVFA